MDILKIIKRAVIKLFGTKDISDAIGMDISISQAMINQIEKWQNCYAGKAPWLTDTVRSLRLEQSIAKEFANIAVGEMTVNITDKRIEKLYESVISDLVLHLQDGLASGAMIIKPIGADKVQYLPQWAFIPIEYDVKGRLIKVIFPEYKQTGERDFYTRLEYHSLDPEKGLTITNTAFYSNSQSVLGKEIPLSSVDEWKDLEPKINYPLMLHPAFGYYVNPVANTVDGSHAGVSIFAPAIDMIRRADILSERLDWEFESGERKISADAMAIKPEDNKISDRLFLGLDVGNAEDFFKEFSPAFRQTDIISGLDEYKREIEFQCGLAYGDISNPQTFDKTATEIKASKQRKYSTVNAIQQNLKFCIDDLVYALAFYAGLTQSGYEVNINFEDSILTDDETRRASDRQDVSMGVMPLWEYRMKWYGEDEKTAKSMTSDTIADVIGDDIPVSGNSSSGNAEVQGKSLNGAQTQSLIAIMSQLSAGAITEGQAINLISTAIGISKEDARKIINGDIE